MRRSVNGWGALIGVVIGFAVSSAVAKPKVIPVAELSPELKATVTIDSAVPAAARIAILDRKTDKQVLSMQSPGLSPETANGEVTVNHLEFPYGPTSAIIYRDFDFDGRPDLALLDGGKSCYMGPAYTVFLRRGKGFQRSAAFTRLAHEYCGMFEINAEQHRLRTMMKSGCCQHSFESYEVVAGAPRLVEEVFDDSIYVRTTRHWPNGAKDVSYELRGPDDETKARLLFGFDLVTPRPDRYGRDAEPQRIEVIEVDGRLDYVLLRRRDRGVQLSYELHVAPFQRSPELEWDPKRGELRFTNGPYQYVVHDSPKHLGASVHGPGIDGFVPGSIESREGSLTSPPSDPLANVRVVH